jgi:hypothetical protein
MSVNPPSFQKLSIVLIAVFLVMAGVTAVESFRDPVATAFQDDYGALSLSHGLAVDINFGGARGKIATGPRTTHPGLSYQAMSWVNQRLLTLGADDAFTRAGRLFDRTALFFRVSIVFCLLLSAAGLYFWWRFARHLGAGVLPFIAALAYPFHLSETWRFAIGPMGNETFALLFSGIFALLVRRVMVESLPGQSSPPLLKSLPSARLNRLMLVAAFGLVSSCIALLKLNYLVWFAGLFIALVSVSIGGNPLSRGFRKSFLFFLAAVPFALLFGYLQARLMIGNEGIQEMFQRHVGIIMHSGHYGSGEETVVSVGELSDNLKNFFSASGHILIFPALIIATALVLRRRFPKSDSVEVKLALFFMVLAVSAFALDVAATLKHYFAHYLIAGMVIFSAYLLVELRKWSHQSQAIIALLSVVGSIYGWSGYQKHLTSVFEAAKAIQTVPEHTARSDDPTFVIYAYGARHPLGETAWAVLMSTNFDAARAWKDSRWGRNLHSSDVDFAGRILWGRDRRTLEEFPWKFLWVAADESPGPEEGTQSRTSSSASPDAAFFDQFGVRADYLKSHVSGVQKVGPYWVIERNPADLMKSLPAAPAPQAPAAPQPAPAGN